MARSGRSRTLRKVRFGMVATAVAAAGLTAVIALGEPVAPAASVLEGGVWDTLYRDGWWRRATGFGLLGCSLAAAGFSVRKRWKFLRFGHLTWWRLAHSAIGTLVLAVLVAHTGLRLGSGLNQALMLSFLAASAFGAAAAARSGKPKSRWLLWVHILAVWPFPVLLGFHILSAYYF